MRRLSRILPLLAGAILVLASQATAALLAPTPPMGWNSWDAYGLTITEPEFRANVAVLASLKRYGWRYAVVDEGWYMAKPFGDNLASRKYLLDANGLLEPVESRFPSSAGGAGFKPLVDWVHAQGLKFGVHIVRGIPKAAVDANSPIAGSAFHAADAADKSDLCGWDDGNYGVRDTPAGQAYYDSMMKQYADWGLDFIKVDCIADHPYKVSEIRQIQRAIQKTGRPIVLSLSPGPTNLSHATEIADLSQMWRIANDLWDSWRFDRHTDDGFPNGLVTAFGNIAKWAPYTRPGAWPDADMLPIGSLTPHPGWGEPRQSRMTHDEERTQFTLWSIARSPIILGNNLTQMDEFTRDLITNSDVIMVNQTGRDSHPISDLPAGFEDARVWVSTETVKGKPVTIVALFNLKDQPSTLKAAWKALGAGSGRKAGYELWDKTRTPRSGTLTVTLPAHGAVIYRVN